MTRRVVYGVGLWIAIAATVLTLISIAKPTWLSYKPDGSQVQYSYGLHQRCSTIRGTCTKFPEYDDCRGHNRAFCSMWRSVGFFMSFAVVLEFATLIAYVVVLLGGKQKRDRGWKIVSSLLFITGAVQCASMAIVVYLFDNDGRFFEGWRLDTSWILCTVSWCICMLSSAGLLSAAIFLPEEGDYELIPN